MRARERFRQLLAETPDDAQAIEFEHVWWTWGELRAVAARIGEALGEAGLGADSRIGMVAENRPEHLAVLFECLSTDRCVVMSSPLQPAERLAADLACAKSPAVIASFATLTNGDVVDAISATGLVIGLGPDGSAAVIGGRVDDSADAVAQTGTAVEMLSSGTTGPPKRIHLRGRQIDAALSSSSTLPAEGSLLRPGVSIATAPVTHMGGLWAVLGNAYAGRRLALLPRFQVDAWVDVVERHQPRACGLVPAAVRAVLEAKVDPERIASLQAVTCGTTYCPPELADAFFNRYGIRVLMTYGATEFAGAVATWTYQLHKEWWDTKAGSVGRAVSGVELRVVDPDGRPLTSGEAGTLEARGEQSIGGESEWVRTSDLARIDADGFVWIEGRVDDVIIRGGFKVQPNTVRNVLERHPAVSEAAVIGIPDERLGAVPVAAVELRAGADVPTSEELVNWSRAYLTPYEAPIRVAVLDALPRTASAKVSRVDLMELFKEVHQSAG